MSNNFSLENFSNLVERLKSEETNLLQKLSKVREQLKTVQAAEDVWNQYNEKLAPLESITHALIDDSSLINELRQLKAENVLTQVTAVERIAQKKGGELSSAEAKRIMIKSGFIPDNKNADNAICQAFEKGNFERVKRGIYKIVNHKSS